MELSFSSYKKRIERREGDRVAEVTGWHDDQQGVNTQLSGEAI